MFRLSSVSTASAEVPESPDPIKFVLNEWTGQHLLTMITGEIVKRMGCNVEYVVAGVQPQFIALAEGELHANMEVRDNNLGEILPQALEDGRGSILAISA